MGRSVGTSVFKYVGRFACRLEGLNSLVINRWTLTVGGIERLGCAVFIHYLATPQLELSIITSEPIYTETAEFAKT